MAKKTNIVGKTKNQIRLFAIILLVLGWIFTLSILADNGGEREQSALITSAKTFLEDKLYIRAVNNYVTALENYNTEKNPEIETELVSIYLEAGMMEEYYSLIKSRIEKASATEEEYHVLAKKYIEEGSITRALDVLSNGMNCFENDEMIQLREQILYEYKVRTVNLPELMQPADNWRIPAFDGEMWGYVSSDGDVILDFIYEEATQFCKGYAVVKLDGVYTLIDEKGYRNAVDKNNLDAVTDISATSIVGVKDGKYQIYSRTFKLVSEETFDYVYLNDNGLYVVQKGGKWAILSADLKPVTDYIFTDVAENTQGTVFYGKYAMVADERGYFLVNEEGKELYAERFYDAKGFEGGLCAVADKNGKWGFANGKAELIVDYQYTDAHSFSCNLGAVEYAGKWGYINRYNTMIIDAQYMSAYPFVEGMAVTETDLGGYDILTLKYYELF